MQATLKLLKAWFRAQLTWLHMIGAISPDIKQEELNSVLSGGTT